MVVLIVTNNTGELQIQVIQISAVLENLQEEMNIERIRLITNSYQIVCTNNVSLLHQYSTTFDHVIQSGMRMTAEE